MPSDSNVSNAVVASVLNVSIAACPVVSISSTVPDNVGIVPESTGTVVAASSLINESILSTLIVNLSNCGCVGFAMYYSFLWCW